jgi:hypothetical protein
MNLYIYMNIFMIMYVKIYVYKIYTRVYVYFIEINIYARYERHIEDVVRLYNIRIEDFNNMSVKLSDEPSLKQRILLQAYYYRIAADLEANIQPTQQILPSIPNKNMLSPQKM